MHHRRVSRGSWLAAALGVMWLGLTPVGGQDVPRTAWGDPDLNGVWSYASLTPLQRPDSMEGRAFYTDEEAAERNAFVHVDRAPPPGSVGAYNALWFDRGKVSSDKRTSLIVDPPDGRLPLRQETRDRTAARAAYLREHPADSWLDRSNWGPVHHLSRRPTGLDRLQQHVSHRFRHQTTSPSTSRTSTTCALFLLMDARR